MNIHQRMRARSTKSGSLVFLSQTPRENLKKKEGEKSAWGKQKKDVKWTEPQRMLVPRETGWWQTTTEGNHKGAHLRNFLPLQGVFNFSRQKQPSKLLSWEMISLSDLKYFSPTEENKPDHCPCRISSIPVYSLWVSAKYTSLLWKFSQGKKSIPSV